MDPIWVPHAAKQEDEKIATISVAAGNVRLLAAALTDASARVRQRAFFSLEQQHSPTTFHTLLRSLPEGNGWDLAHLLRSYRKSHYTRAMIQSLKNKNPHVRGPLVLALSLAGDQTAFRPITELFSDKAPNVVWEAIYGAARYQGKKERDYLMRLARNGKKHQRYRAIDSLGLAHENRAFPLLLNILMGDKDPHARHASAVAIERFKESAFHDQVAPYLSHPDAEFRKRAIWALRLMSAYEYVPRLELMAREDRDPGVRRLATEQLGYLRNR